ncbi:MAG: hypothetical protein E7Z95_05235 [Actinomyces succiniciruminis]|nr:hypothetical protein [Actinomyces succiniciruminis]
MASATGESDERADGQIEVDRAGAGTEAESVGYSDVSPSGGNISAVSPGRRLMRNVLQGSLVVALVVVGGVSGWLWWTRPLTRQVALPDELAAKDGTYAQVHVSIEPIETAAGQLQVGPLRSEGHEWIGTLLWRHNDGTQEPIELRLGETTHIDGLGTVTLLAVNPEPLLPDYRAGGWTYKVYIVLDPGIEIMW